MSQNLDNTNTTGTYYEGLSDFEPTPEDKEALFWSHIDSMRDPLSAEPARSNSFKSHPAYRWAVQHTTLSRTDRESFTVYSNNYQDPSTGLFSLSLESIYSQFLQFGMEP